MRKIIIITSVFLVLISCSKSNNNEKDVEKIVSSLKQELKKDTLNLVDSDLFSENYKKNKHIEVGYYNFYVLNPKFEKLKIDTKETITNEGDHYIFRVDLLATLGAFSESKSFSFFITKITNINKWRISDTENFLRLPKLDLKVLGYDWDSQSDRDKMVFIKNLKENIKIKVEKKGIFPYKGSKEGEVKILNSTGYDIENLNMIIKFFDKSGTQIKTRKEYIRGVVKNDSYSYKEWYVSDCRRCVKEDFEVTLLRE